jgi:hypothetical protein
LPKFEVTALQGDIAHDLQAVVDLEKQLWREYYSKEDSYKNQFAAAT